MITIDNLSYEIGTRVILDRVSFNIDANEKVALIGQNGTGKSTLIKILMGKLSPKEGGITFPKVTPRFGYMPQHISELEDFPQVSVLDFMLSGRDLASLSKKLEEKLEDLNRKDLTPKKMEKLASEYSDLFEDFMVKDGYSAEDELLEILIGVGLPELDLDQKVSSLSGGQKTKLAFARVLFSKPDVMVLDEPTNHLEESAVMWIVNYLSTYRGAILIVSHSPNILDELVSKVVYLNGDGTATLFRGDFSDFLKKKSELDKSQIRLFKKQEREKRKLEEFIEHWRGGTKKKVSQVHDREKKLSKLQDNMVGKIQEQRSISIEFPLSVSPVIDVLKLSEVSKSYGDNEVLQNVSFALQRGERMIIVGPNGAGKTTLLKIIAGKTSPDKGKVSLGKRVKIGYYAQEHESLTPENSVLEEASSASLHPQSRLRSILAHFLFPGDRVFTKVKSLSLGERSRLALAKLVLSGDNLLLLDEPTNHLDYLSRERVRDALARYEGTILIVSHDEEFVRAIGTEKELLLPENQSGFLNQIAKG